MKLRIKELQEQKNTKNVDLAKLTGIGVQQINYYRVGKRTPPLTSLEKLAKGLNCTTFELLEAPEGFEHNYKDEKWLGIRKK